MPVRAQANPVIGTLESVDVDISVTASPVAGTGGNQMNEATGDTCGVAVAAAMTGGFVTVNVTGSLRPAGFPSALSCMATAVY